MATHDDTTPSAQPDEVGKQQTPGSEADDTFETDVSETGEDGTTVRPAEVREDDLSETRPEQQQD
ncbi:hypothetical protein [Paraburkholderia sp. J41]|uniref:hypothetical protein n=1 Tax=Paraburkholderia sp. J41 TaxID=2805433 RepID=UPI0039F48EA5